MDSEEKGLGAIEAGLHHRGWRSRCAQSWHVLSAGVLASCAQSPGFYLQHCKQKREKEGQIKGRREEGKEREREAARHKYPPSFLCSLGLLFYDIFITSLRTK
jgi:hypothetical protein